jgi:purine-binding chemotaxis protein CheW
MSALFVVFRVGEGHYALAAEHVLQLESFAGVTAVPGALPHVAGIVQVRGRIVPVIDLRLRFGLPAVEPVLDTRIVVVEYNGRTVGLRVDSGREVTRLEVEQFQATPAIVSEQSSGFVLGIARVGERILMLVDLAKVLGEEKTHDVPANTLPGNSIGQRALPG